MGAITIPYTDQLVATGWVLPCVVFAVIGGILGAIVGLLTRLVRRDKTGPAIASRLQRGQQLVMVRAEESQIPLVQSILARSHTVPKAALATSEPLYDVDVPTTARTVVDEVEPVISADRRARF